MMSTRRKRTRSLIIFASGMVLALQIFVGCKPVNKGFSGEMAYNHVEVLVNFGPREPGTEAISKAQNYIEKELNGYGWKILRQSFSDETPIGVKRFVNLRARYSPDSDEIDWKDGGGKILICSHYDTKIMENINFLGANDGGSSTGVLIELGRVLSKDSERAKRIELVFFDGEEAVVDFTPVDGLYGSRYYAKYWRSAPLNKKPIAAYILDLVGDENMRIDPPIDSPRHLLSELYKASRQIGKKSLFGIHPTPITDDHVPLNAAGIPALDIIDSDYISGGKWHQEGDNLESVSPQSLNLIGDVMLQIIENTIPAN